MLVFLNGQFVPEEQAMVSVFDRSFLYGDGLFETMLVCNRQPFRWKQHLERLQRGAEFLKLLKISASGDRLRAGFCKRADDLPTEQPRPAGDDGDFSIESKTIHDAHDTDIASLKPMQSNRPSVGSSCR